MTTGSITEKFLREAIAEVRAVMAFDTGTWSDNEILTAKGAVVGALVQAKAIIHAGPR
jgi:hypothetical protein